MHGYADDTRKYRKDAILRLEAFFEVQKFVPEGMSQEVEADAVRAALKESCTDVSNVKGKSEGLEREEQEWRRTSLVQSNRALNMMKHQNIDGGGREEK